jgi:AcrR family transcriptional regulator
VPRPRFDNLDPERRAAILSIAAEEFAEHGYEGASYNRIIERSGLSKGAIYYYFDDKEDLYATVLKGALQRLVMDVGRMHEARDAEGFWREFDAWTVRSLHMFQAEPHAVGLARSLVTALARGAATGALAELRRGARSFMEGFIAHGQSLGAIRDDLPPDLLLAVLMGVEEAIDLWLGDRIGSMSDEEIEATAAMLGRLYQDVAGGRSKTATRAKKKKSTSARRKP